MYSALYDARSSKYTEGQMLHSLDKCASIERVEMSQLHELISKPKSKPRSDDDDDDDETNKLSQAMSVLFHEGKTVFVQ